MSPYRGETTRLAIIAVTVCAAAACMESALVPCGSRLCPAGTVCTAAELCASADQLAACEGLADGQTCIVSSSVGYCDRGVCIAAGCGNGVIDPNEMCDDGNSTSGDGCRDDCQKIERCGDAEVDTGEACDDANENAADGCHACVAHEWRAAAVIGGSATATTVGLLFPAGVAVDLRGNIYVADTDAHRIRRVDSTGVTTTLAGTGTPGFSGDGGPATSAELRSPAAVAVDGLGNVYIADTFNFRLRRIDPSGIITTIAGTGASGFSGDGSNATSAQLSGPRGVAVDGLGNVYIADTFNDRIRKIDVAGTITTIAGTGVRGFGGDGGAATAAMLDRPYSVTVASNGIYIADTWNHRIRFFTAGGTISTRAGTGIDGFSGDGGAATIASLSQPASVAVDAAGTLYIADTTNQRIRKVSAGTITTIAGDGTPAYAGDNGPALSARVAYPAAVTVDAAGAVYVADSDNHRVRRIDASGTIATAAGSGTRGDAGDGGAATSALFDSPNGVATSSTGNIYVADALQHCVRRVDPSGVITTIAGTGISGFAGDGGPAAEARLTGPSSLVVDMDDNVYIADVGNHRIRRVDPSGVITTVAGSGISGFAGDGGQATSARLSQPAGVAVAADGNLYIADTNNHRIRRVDAQGVISTVAGTGIAGSLGDGGAATAAQLNRPSRVAVDGAGNIYVSDTVNHRVRRINSAGIITTVAGTGVAGASGDGGPAVDAQLSSPSGIAVDGTGQLYIADRGNERIRRVSATGTIATVLGTGTAGFSGDGAAASAAQISLPQGVAIDPSSQLFVADSGNDKIRRVDSAGVVTTVAGRIDPQGAGPLTRARLADPSAIIATQDFMLFAAGSSGTVELADATTLAVVAGRYPQAASIGTRARYRAQTFGSISGIAYDAARDLIYITESSAHRLHVITRVVANDPTTWTIAPLANAAGTAGFSDGAAQTAQLRDPAGLFFDPVARQLYVADRGNHVVRAIDLSGTIAAAVVTTVAGMPQTRGFYGDGAAATQALLFAPTAITKCGNGDLFVADTGNHRVRRIAAQTGTITTVVGVGVAASSGDGRPASTFPVSSPRGVACDAIGNLYVTSTSRVRQLPADDDGVVDGTGMVQTIYGTPPADRFPASVTRCLTGITTIDATTVRVTDSCVGLLVELRLEPRP